MAVFKGVPLQLTRVQVSVLLATTDGRVVIKHMIQLQQSVLSATS